MLSSILPGPMERFWTRDAWCGQIVLSVRINARAKTCNSGATFSNKTASIFCDGVDRVSENGEEQPAVLNELVTAEWAVELVGKTLESVTRPDRVFLM